MQKLMWTLFITTAVFILSCGGHEPIQRQPVSVKVEVVGGSKGSGGLRYSASIEPDVQVDLAFKVNGYVEEILQVTGADGRSRSVQDGDVIKKGTVLARIRSQEYSDRVAEAQASMTQAKADYDRALNLYENQSISKADYDASYARYTSAQARYRQAAADLADCQLRAPMDGVILKRTIENGALVGPASGGAFVIADVRNVKAVFGVTDLAVSTMKMGASQAIATEAFPGTEFTGTITRIASFADPVSRVFEVECTIPNKDNRLKPGMIASLKTATEIPAIQAVFIPLNAVVRPKNSTTGYAVYVVKENGESLVSREQIVELGDVMGNMIAVEKGLGGGEQVVIAGATMLADSQEVIIIP